MSGASSSEAEWLSALESAGPPADLAQRPDDPRLGDIIEYWQGNLAALRPGRAVLVGFPQDEGVRRNGGRVGAAEAPQEIRRWLSRLTPWHAEGDIDLARQPPLDLGNVREAGGLEGTSVRLAGIVAQVLAAGAVPVVLGGGHETAFPHYLSYVEAGLPAAVINIDAHLDVRPLRGGRGHSGSPFRQMLELPAPHALPGKDYVCLGAQQHSVSRAHVAYVQQQGGTIVWAAQCQPLVKCLDDQLHRLGTSGSGRVYLSLDADAFAAGDVPGVSAPNPNGLPGPSAFACAEHAGRHPAVSSFDLVEINPRYDRDGQSARWGALVLWHFLIGLARRPVLAFDGAGRLE